MGNTTLNGITIHNGSSAVINSNACSKSSSLTVIPLYLNDSENTNVFDFGGTVKTINLSGGYIADTVAGLKTWVESLEGLQQGHQDVDAGAPYEFVDDLRGTINVKVLEFTSTQVQAEPTRVTWTIKLVQSSTNA